MKALVYHSRKKVKVEQVPDPILKKPDDLILKITSTAICGSDLHIYNGFFPQKRPQVLGHEFMGEVVEKGSDVHHLRKGDRVIVPFPIACGRCFFCRQGLVPHCEDSNPNFGPEGGTSTERGGALFGYTDLYGGCQGGQAEFVRVPYANFGPRKIDTDLRDEEVLFLTDIFPTGWSAVDWAELKGGETVAVFGCGPVGIMAQKAAWLQGAGKVIGIDLLDYRLKIAKKSAGSQTFNIELCDIVEVIRDLTNGRGADVCIDAVGMEADRSILEKMSNATHRQAGTINVIKFCASAVRRGGVISVVGVYGSNYSGFPLGQIFDKAITLKTGQALVQTHVDHLLELVKKKKVILNDIITHTFPLEKAPYAYDIFCNKKDECLKVILKP